MTSTQHSFLSTAKTIAHLTKIAIKNIQWTVILRSPHIMHIILHLQLNTIPLIVLAALEFLVAIFLRQPIQRPLLVRIPILLAPCYNNWFVWKLVLIYELLGAARRLVGAFTIICEVPEPQKIVHVSMLSPGLLRC